MFHVNLISTRIIHPAMKAKVLKGVKLSGIIALLSLTVPAAGYMKKVKTLASLEADLALERSRISAFNKDLEISMMLKNWEKYTKQLSSIKQLTPLQSPIWFERLKALTDIFPSNVCILNLAVKDDKTIVVDVVSRASAADWLKIEKNMLQALNKSRFYSADYKIIEKSTVVVRETIDKYKISLSFR